jgi:copper homeostasis protein
MVIVEVIAFTLQSCLLIEKAGAHRIELCDNPAEGGTTPSYGMIKTAREKVAIDVFPIIRPRGGDFLYTDEEFSIMQRDIALCKELGCNGVVVGLLLPDGSVDTVRTKKLVELAYPLEVTFHRAFDRVRDAAEALEAVIDCGCTRILTSGQRPTVNEGVENIAAMAQQADGRITIMPGSGVRAANAAEIVAKTGAVEIHTSARTVQPSGMQYINEAMKEDLSMTIADPAEIQAILQQFR